MIFLAWKSIFWTKWLSVKRSCSFFSSKFSLLSYWRMFISAIRSAILMISYSSEFEMWFEKSGSTSTLMVLIWTSCDSYPMWISYVLIYACATLLSYKLSNEFPMEQAHFLILHCFKNPNLLYLLSMFSKLCIYVIILQQFSSFSFYQAWRKSKWFLVYWLVVDYISVINALTWSLFLTFVILMLFQMTSVSVNESYALNDFEYSVLSCIVLYLVNLESPGDFSSSLLSFKIGLYSWRGYKGTFICFVTYLFR